ncbi:hypothetical protein BGZ73_003215 [Actinomortierella ambigua]|nr:hypothetical protein BGZ73_003215 [Actinomortierella ambigua]
MQLFKRTIPPVPEPGSNPGVSPEFSSSLPSRLTFHWVQPLMSLGARRPLETEDLWLVSDKRNASNISAKFQEEWAKEVAKSRHPSSKDDLDLEDPLSEKNSKGKKKKKRSSEPKLWKAINRTFFWTFWYSGILKVIGDAFMSFQPLVTKAIITFVTTSYFGHIARNQGNDAYIPPLWHGILLSLALFLMGVGATIAQHQFWQRSTGVGVGLRTALITAIYRKGLVLSNKAKQDFSTGKITNIMSTDTTRLDLIAGYFHILWTAPLMVVTTMILLLVNLGPSALAGVGLLLVFGPLQARVVMFLSIIRRKSTLITDARVKLTQEVLQGIRVIKFYGWEDAFLKKLDDLRAQELKFVRQLLISRSGVAAVNLTIPVFASIVTFVVYNLAGNDLNAAIVFSSLSLFNIMRMPLMILPQVVSGMVDALVSIHRVQDFLLADELEDLPPVNLQSEHAIAVKNGSFEWDGSLKALTMEDLKKQERMERNRHADKKAEKKERRAQEKMFRKRVKKYAKVHQVSYDEAEKRVKKEDMEELNSNSSDVTSVHEKLASQLADKDPMPDTASMIESASVRSKDSDSNSNSSNDDDDDDDKPTSDSSAVSEEKAPFRLKNINLTIPRGKLVAVVGAVGSGKSSLLNAMVGEMRKATGSIEFGGTVGYSPQSAWIQNATVMDNILFGLPYDERKYQRVIRQCALERDIHILPQGDQTEIGERGVNLSGGQKQRVNIARAVYFDADIVLLDDPLSAVDAHVGKYLFKHCIKGALDGKTRVLVTHQLHVLPEVDYVVCMKNGEIVEQGTFQQLMDDQGEFAELMKAHGGMEDEDTAAADADADVNTEAGSLTEKAEEQSKTVGSSGDPEKEELKKDTQESKKSDTPKAPVKGLMQTEERSTGSVSGKIYKEYFRATGGSYIVPMIVITMTLTQIAKVGNDLWLSWWTSDALNETPKFYMILYAVWGLAQGFFQFSTGFFFSIAGANAARAMHQVALQNIVRAPTSFFDTTPMGRIINRFSKDVDAIDNMLSEAYRMFVNTGAIVISTFILICVIFPWFLAPLVPMLVFYYYAAIYYRSTSRELKRLDSILRSSLYAHFSESLGGLSSIRAYRVQDRFQKKNESFLDLENRAYLPSLAIQRWLGVRLETIANTLVFFTSLFGVLGRFNVNPATIGLVLSYSMSVTGTFNWCVRQYAEVENNMNAVERLHHYAHELELEAPAIVPDNRPDDHWPSQGAIEIRNLEMRYRPELPSVLHNLSLDIKGGEKIGVVGRTGAGKSSIMVALFRMVEASKGSIKIDGVDIGKLGLFDLRTRLAIIPQDPVLFSGTIRTNLDPFQKHSDQALWDVLERSNLKAYVQGSQGGLDSQVAEYGENLSVGQRQLLCLARAMLTNARILIMDEATANVDVQSDVLIQQAMRKEFHDRTILTIAHRLNTVIDFNRILVLDHGDIKEFDTPANLLSNPASVFSSMVDETGPTNAALLRRLAVAAAKGESIDLTAALDLKEEVVDQGHQGDKAELDQGDKAELDQGDKAELDERIADGEGSSSAAPYKVK